MMSTFNVFAGVLIIVVLAVFFRTIFKARVSSSNTQSQTNLRLLRDQLKELAEDHRVGNLSTEQYELSKVEIEGRVLEEVSKEPRTMILSGRYAKIASFVAVILIPVGAVYLYDVIGSPEGQDVAAFVAAQSESFDQTDLQSLADKVIKHIEENPEDTQAWVCSLELIKQCINSKKRRTRGSARIKSIQTIPRYWLIMLRLEG